MNVQGEAEAEAVVSNLLTIKEVAKRLGVSDRIARDNVEILVRERGSPFPGARDKSDTAPGPAPMRFFPESELPKLVAIRRLRKRNINRRMAMAAIFERGTSVNVVIEIVEDSNKPLGNSQSRRCLSVDDARLTLGSAAVDEALALHVASRAELSAVHQELGEKVQELIDAAGREERLRLVLERAAQRLRALNAHVFDQGNFTDRHGDGDVNRAVIAACEEVLK